MSEQWRSVVGYEGVYEVSDRGRVKRVKAAPGSRIGHILKPRKNPRGYSWVVLCDGPGTASDKSVHRLVCAAFLGKCPVGMEVNHKDGDQQDNTLSNLEYVTHAQNIQHAHDMGRGNKVRTKMMGRVAARLRLRGWSYAQLAEIWGVGAMTLHRAVKEAVR